MEAKELRGRLVQIAKHLEEMQIGLRNVQAEMDAVDMSNRTDVQYVETVLAKVERNVLRQVVTLPWPLDGHKTEKA